MEKTTIELEFEDPAEFMDDFIKQLNEIDLNSSGIFKKIEELTNMYEDLGFGEEQFTLTLYRIFIK